MSTRETDDASTPAVPSGTPWPLAVVGHTNTGKTSLMRTLTRDERFGEVCDAPSTTRDVRGAVLLADGRPMVALYDTPGLEDAVGLETFLASMPGSFPDPVARIETFLGGDHDAGRYEQEAKVLRAALSSAAVLYVVDLREPVLERYRAELRLLSACGRPLMPVMNFAHSNEARLQEWQAQLARLGLHVQAVFDTVVYSAEAESQLMHKLGVLLEAARGAFDTLWRCRVRDRRAQRLAATQLIARMLVDVAGARQSVADGGDLGAALALLQQRIREAERRCVHELLELYRFELGAWRTPELPLDERGQWTHDVFDPEALREVGIKAGSAAAAGGMAGLAIDAMTGGLSLGAAALVGAGLGALWGASGDLGPRMLARLRGYRNLMAAPETLALLANRQCRLLVALLQRGHAAQAPLSPSSSVPAGAGGWPSVEIRNETLRLRSHPEWSRLNEAGLADVPQARVNALAQAISAQVVEQR